MYMYIGYSSVKTKKPCKCNDLPPYTQFAIQDSRLFGPNPWTILAPPSNYLSKKGFLATQPLEQILVAEFLLCELGVDGNTSHPQGGIARHKVRDKDLYTTTNKCLQCLLEFMYSILNNWCISKNISCGQGGVARDAEPVMRKRDARAKA